MATERIAIVGTGGHAREVHEILQAQHAAGQDVSPLGFVEPGDARRPPMMNGLPVLGGFEWLERERDSGIEVICAVGTPSHCERLARRVRDVGLPFASAVAPEAWIARSASLGTGIMVFPGVVVNANVVVGDHVTLNVGSSVSHDSVVRDFCSVSPGARIAGNVSVGAGCFLGMGANVTQGVSIGEHSVVGAGAVVIRDLPPGITAVGVPARVVGPASETPMRRGGDRR